MAETKDKILDAAELLFAEKGLGDTSLRAITQAADVNLAAVNYHFGGKDGLVLAVYERRIDSLNKRRLQLLEQARSAGSPGLEAVLEAYIRPALDVRFEPAAARYIKLLGRAYTEPNEQLRAFLPKQYDDVMECFKPELQRHLPGLAKEEIYWRMHFCVGALIYCMAGADMMTMSSACQLCDPNDTEGMISRLVAFVAAGMRSAGQPPASVQVV